MSLKFNKFKFNWLEIRTPRDSSNLTFTGFGVQLFPEDLKLKNEAFVRDFRKQWNVDYTIDVRIAICFCNFQVNASKVLCLPWIQAYELLYLPREMTPEVTRRESKFAALPQIQRPRPETSTAQSAKSLRLPRRKRQFEPFSNPPPLPTFLQPSRTPALAACFATRRKFWKCLWHFNFPSVAPKIPILEPSKRSSTYHQFKRCHSPQFFTLFSFRRAERRTWCSSIAPSASTPPSARPPRSFVTPGWKLPAANEARRGLDARVVSIGDCGVLSWLIKVSYGLILILICFW